MNPLVSVVIPVYNRRELVQKAIASVRSQSYNNWELVVADDGSNDGRNSAIEALNDSRIRVIMLKH